MDRLATLITALRLAVFDILRNRITHILIGLAVIYWTIAAFVPGKDLIEVLGLIAIGVYGAAAVRWIVPAVRSIREGDTSGVAQLLLGVTFFMASSAIMRIWAQVWRWNDYAGWMVESPWLGFILLSSVCGAAMMITSPGSTASSVPNANVRWLLAAMGVGGILVGFMLKAAVDTKVQASRTMEIAELSRPGCSVSRPVWGNERSHIYHEPGSAYRGLVRPTRCFESSAEAEANGFRRATARDR